MDRIRWIKKILGVFKNKDIIAPNKGLKVNKILVTLATSGHYAMLASNFDLEAHLQEYPPLGCGFDEKKYNLNFDPDKIVYILGLLSSIPARNKDLIREDGFVPINTTMLNQKVTDYRFYLDYLELTGVIEVTLITCQKFIQGATNGLKNIILNLEYIITERHLTRKAI